MSPHPSNYPSIWPPNVPRFYPQLDGGQLSQFLDYAEYQRICALPQICILPFASQNSREKDVLLGIGLAKLMIRDLMLVRNLSTRGPEDSPESYLESVPQLREQKERTVFISGETFAGNGSYRVELQFFSQARSVPYATVVHENDFPTFVLRLAETIARTCTGEVSENTRQMWRYGRPSSALALMAIGEACATYSKGEEGRSRSLWDLYQREPNLVIALHDLDEEMPQMKQVYLEAMRRDPYDAQLCFLTFLAFWESRGPQPEAMQFCRRAIELSPGHGKAHMCAPHAADRSVNMILHSDLGYRLLPGNTFAINNYILSLREIQAPPQQILALAQEGINADPYNPGSYDRMIDLCMELGDFRTALGTAERLQTLLAPQIHPRTLYCLQQNPQRAALLRSGEYNPALENQKIIWQLRQRLGMARN